MTTPNAEPDCGAECVKAYDEYAARNGYNPTCPPGDLTPYRDWIKPVAPLGDEAYRALQELPQPRKRSFLARLADSVRGRK